MNNSIDRHFGDGTGDSYKDTRLDRYVRVEQGQQARLITGALAEKPVIMGRVFQSEGGWVFEDVTGVQTRFEPGADPESPTATWTSLRPEVKHENPALKTALEAFRRAKLYYGNNVQGQDFRHKDGDVFGRRNSDFPNGLEGLPAVSQTHFYVGLERDGGAFVEDANSTNHTWVAVIPADQEFKDMENRTVQTRG